MLARASVAMTDRTASLISARVQPSLSTQLGHYRDAAEDEGSLSRLLGTPLIPFSSGQHPDLRNPCPYSLCSRGLSPLAGLN